MLIQMRKRSRNCENKQTTRNEKKRDVANC